MCTYEYNGQEQLCFDALAVLETVSSVTQNLNDKVLSLGIFA